MAINMFIKFEDPALAGGSTAEGHKDEIEVLSWNHGFAQPTSPTRSTAGGGTVEQANHQNFTFTKYLDASTNDLLKMCWSGKQIGKATLRCYRADGARDNQPVEYLQVIMTHVIISNFSVSGGPGDVPVENVSLDYGTVQYIYKQQKHDDESAMHDLRSRAIQ
ncbi:MAG TPA: type VI secretion system tube protein Hcp [Thermoanaerobaculia bacterium]|nr:type VI secretion system tube protein Hcp [Thermoanaerobaculia bacterium]